MNDRNELSDTDRCINRHIARLLSELEEAHCPSVYVQAVKSKLSWLRSDLKELEEMNNDRRIQH
jgi:hypothetical protein